MNDNAHHPTLPHGRGGARAGARAGGFAVTAVASTVGLARSTLTARLTPAAPRQRGRPPQPDTELVDRIKAIISNMPTYGYRRVHALLRRAARRTGRSAGTEP